MRKLPLLMIACAVTSGVTFVSGATLAADDTAAAPVAASEQPDATLTLNGGSFATGIGFTWGHGDLTYQGEKHKFRISGVSVVDVGAAKITAEGNVYHLTNLKDFPGNYTVTSAGLAAAGGGSATYMKNERGVVIKLSSTDLGIRFHLSVEGVKVNFAE